MQSPWDDVDHIDEVEKRIFALQHRSSWELWNGLPRLQKLSQDVQSLVHRVETEVNGHTYRDYDAASPQSVATSTGSHNSPRAAVVPNPNASHYGQPIQRSSIDTPLSPCSDPPQHDIVQIEKMIRAANSGTHDITAALKAINIGEIDRVCSRGDPRIEHLRPLLLFKEDPSADVSANDRLWMVLASMSLAADLAQFETNNKWVPKWEQLVSAVCRHDILSIKKIPNRTEQFANAMKIQDRDQREALRQGMSLAFKLQVLQAILNPKKNKGAAMLFGFECCGILKLTYKNFRELQRIIEDGDPQAEVSFTHMEHFCAVSGFWYGEHQARYDQMSRKIWPEKG